MCMDHIFVIHIFLSGHQVCFHPLAVMPLIYLLPLECNFPKGKCNFSTSLCQHMLDAKQTFLWVQMNGFSMSAIAESRSYDEVKQALILKGKKSVQEVIEFTLLESHKNVYGMLFVHIWYYGRKPKSGIWWAGLQRTPLSPAFSILPRTEKILLIHLLYSTTPCWRWDKRKHFTGEEAWRQIEQLWKHYYMEYFLIRLSNCETNFITNSSTIN